MSRNENRRLPRRIPNWFARMDTSGQNAQARQRVLQERRDRQNAMPMWERPCIHDNNAWCSLDSRRHDSARNINRRHASHMEMLALLDSIRPRQPLPPPRYNSQVHPEYLELPPQFNLPPTYANSQRRSKNLSKKWKNAISKVRKNIRAKKKRSKKK